MLELGRMYKVYIKPRIKMLKNRFKSGFVTTGLTTVYHLSIFFFCKKMDEFR